MQQETIRTDRVVKKQDMEDIDTSWRIELHVKWYKILEGDDNPECGQHRVAQTVRLIRSFAVSGQKAVEFLTKCSRGCGEPELP